MTKKGYRKNTKKAVADLTSDEVQSLVVDFVRRLRRVALHPLALIDDEDEAIPMPGEFLRKLMNVVMTVTVAGEQPLSMMTPLPDEVAFESLATRVRTFTIGSDRLFWPDALAALDRITGLDDMELKISSEQLREEWREATGRDNRVRAYFVVTDELRQTDVDLAYAWLYQDLAHSDPVSTGHLGVQPRFEAAVGVFSHLAVVAIETLHYINGLCELGVIELPVGTFSDRVKATTTGGGLGKVTSVMEVDLDENLDEITLDGPLPKSARPIAEVVKGMREQGYWGDAQKSPD